MIRVTLSLVLAVFLWALAAQQADAQVVCGERAEILERLQEEFSETPQSIAVSEDGALVEVVVSPSGG